MIGANARRIISGVAAAAPLMVASGVSARTTLTVDGGVSGRISSNPFLQLQGEKSAASVSATLSPRLSFDSATGSLSLGGSVRRTEYFERFGPTNAVGVQGNATWNANARTQVTASLGYDNSILGEQGRFTETIDDLPPVDDFILAGLRERRETYTASTGVSYQASGRDTLNGSIFATRSDVDDAGAVGVDYTSYGGSAAYQRALNARTSLGLSGSIQRYKCNDNSCSSTTYQPQVTFSLTLDRRWSLNGSGGVSISRFRSLGLSENSTSAAGSLSLCRKDARTDFCLSASQQVQPTTINGARPALSVNGFGRYRLSSRSSIGFDVAYAGSSQDPLQGGRFRYWTARVSGDRQIGRNVTVNLTAGYDRSETSFFGARSNFEVGAGLNFSLGRRP